MTEITQLTIHFSESQTLVFIGKGSIETSFLSYCPKANQYVIFCDRLLEVPYGQKLKKNLALFGKKISFYSLVGGEAIKTRLHKERIEDLLIESGCNKDTCLIVIGGGSLIDLIGFVAATYCRGIPYITIPSTLLAMTDASLGGKTGVNVKEAKNFIGAIYQPYAVFIDPEYLKTLPDEELMNGLVESIKHSLIASEPLFAFIEKNLLLIKHKDSGLLDHLIKESVRIKKEIIEYDEKERGMRRLLNFGHTVGHALEALSEFSLKHGEAVAFGILAESYFSHHMGYLSYMSFARICDLIHQIFPTYNLPENLSYEQFFKAMCLDKKTMHSLPHMVLLQDIGSPMNFDNDFVCSIPSELLKKGFKWMKTQGSMHVMCSH